MNAMTVMRLAERILLFGSVPPTGDYTDIYLWVSLLLLAADVLLAVILSALLKKPAGHPAAGERDRRGRRR